jgi:hypothetical protein
MIRARAPTKALADRNFVCIDTSLQQTVHTQAPYNQAQSTNIDIQYLLMDEAVCLNLS